MPPSPLPLRLVLAASPTAPGVAEAVRRAARHHAAGVPLEILLVGPGVSWRGDARLAALAAGPGVRVAICSRSARERRVVPEDLPPWLRWSSLVAFFGRDAREGALWGLFP